MSQIKLINTQKKIIKFVKNYYLSNSPFLKKNYFAFYENSPGVLNIKKKILKEKIYKFFFLNYLSSLYEFKTNIFKNKLTNHKKYKNLIITWGTRTSFYKNGVFFDKYFSYKSNQYSKTYWIIILNEDFKIKKLRDNLAILTVKQTTKKINLLFNLLWKILKIKDFNDQDYHIAKSINKFIATHKNFSELKNIIMPYEGQAFQKKIFNEQKKLNNKINCYGFDHSAPHSIATQLIYTKGSPDKLFVTGENTKKTYCRFYNWPKSKIVVTYPNRFKSFNKSDFLNYMFLPYDFDDPDLVIKSFNKFLKSNQLYLVKDLKILIHPMKKKVLKHIKLKQELSRCLNHLNKKRVFKSKKNITVVIGFTSAAIVALEFDNVVLHICPKPEIDLYLKSFWSDIEIVKVDKFSYLYYLKNKGKYLNFKKNDKIRKILNG